MLWNGSNRVNEGEGVDFTNMLMYSFYERRSQKLKMTHDLNCHFCAFGIYARQSCM